MKEWFPVLNTFKSMWAQTVLIMYIILLVTIAFITIGAIVYHEVQLIIGF